MELKYCNCIVVFDKEKERLLFCKRKKQPYSGLYNFIGGKLEKNESSENAAYRELFEETGIGRNDIQLFRLMDITYYQQKLVLEIYVGILHRDVQLIEEVNPLEWISIHEDFADSGRYAGDKNIAHIVEMALMYDMDKSKSATERLKKEALCVGVDGCKGGWVAAVIEQGELRIEKYGNINELIAQYPKFDNLLIDMVIGLPADPKQYDNRPDSTARRLIAPRTSTIFAVPSRQAVYEETEEAQIKVNRSVLGKGLAKQTMAIIPKMRELMERVQILSQFFPNLSVDSIRVRAKELHCNRDDIVDAVCLAVTANLDLQGDTEVIPKDVMVDNHGLKMQMVIPK